MTRYTRAALLAALALAAATAARAVGLAQPTPPDVAFEQRIGSPLPLALDFADAAGRVAPLADAFGGPPVLLLPGYYRCPQLCGLAMHGLLEALHASGLPPAAYRIVRISIDPDDTPASARARRDADLAYAAFLQGDGAAGAPDLRLLTGSGANIDALTRAVGFRFQRGSAGDAARFAHAAGVIVATPGGRISALLPGVRYDGAELRRAVATAAAGENGTLSERIALLCAHVDESLGRHSGAVMGGMRAFGVALALLLAAWIWRQRDRWR